MRRLVIAAVAGLTVAVAGSLTAPRAEAMPLAPPTGMTDQFNMIDKVAVCFYFDGWNGPGFYECGYRHRRGRGWHGRRDDSRHHDRRRDWGHHDRRHDRRHERRRRH